MPFLPVKPPVPEFQNPVFPGAAASIGCPSGHRGVGADGGLTPLARPVRVPVAGADVFAGACAKMKVPRVAAANESQMNVCGRMTRSP
jgi:hypothetical protein